MYNVGHVSFHDIECVYTIDNGGITLIPAHAEDIRKLKSHFDDQHFMFCYGDEVWNNNNAFIDRVLMNTWNSIKLIP